MKKHLTAILLLLASIGFAFAGGPAIPPSASAVTGLGTIATVDSPVPVANGGTGATTAAAGLAALGGASLNGSSTVNFGVKNLSASGFTTLGDAATGVKMKVLTGTTAAAEGGITNIAHGLTGDKIITVTCKIIPASNNGTFACEVGAGYQYSFYHSDTNVGIVLSATESENLLEKPIVVLVWYKE